MFVKVCDVTSEEDALLSVAMGADALGFVFAPSQYQIAVERAGDIVKRLPPEVVTVGVFKNETPERVAEIVNTIGLKGAQLEGRETLAQYRWIRQRVPFTIRALSGTTSAGSPKKSESKEFECDAILVKATPPDPTRAFDWRLEEIPHGKRLILGGALTTNNVAHAVAQVRPWGIDLTRGTETIPGRKDPTKLHELIENARAAAPTEYQGSDAAPYDWQDEI